MSLYLKHRPRSFERMVGNSNLIKTLEGVLSKEDRPHTFLLHGPTGCGKTTLARIITKKVGATGLDIREVNTADNRGIDTVRDIIQKMQFKPIESEAVVWIIDECHKLSNDAQNAFLKPLEDTPPHVYFILCTTDPERLLGTIKGRCSQYQVKALTEEEMLLLLKRVVRKEEETLDDKVYDIIVRDSFGYPRNALQILEQVLQAPVEDRAKVAEQAHFEYSQTIELCRALLNDKTQWKQVSTILAGLKEQEPEGIRRMVLGYCQAILLKGDNWRAGLVMEEFINPFYDTGFPQLVYACYSIIKTK